MRGRLTRTPAGFADCGTIPARAGPTAYGVVWAAERLNHPRAKHNNRYSTDRNLAHHPLPGLLNGFGQILAGSASLLRPRGVIAVTVRPIRVQGELIDLPGQVIDTANNNGLVLVGRCAALLAGLRDGGLVNRVSFFQMLETRRARDRGIPACAIAHEDLLLLRPVTDRPEANR
ncbi:hypothetical protein ACH35V_29650 [Actinomadura sp. 1N219]|uniref:hypothetical protein n=1 Tax=Actinomadura sp. 1N219 TaxID=3375152 RepID=UPI00378B6AC0